jgi:hypothetical protein
MDVRGLEASARRGDSRFAATTIECMPSGTIKRTPLLVGTGARSARQSHHAMLPGALPAEDAAT